MRWFALILFILIATPNHCLAEVVEYEKYYPLPEVLLNELWWEVTGIEDIRDQACISLTSEEEYDQALAEIDDHLSQIADGYEKTQDKIFSVQRICTLAPRYYPNNEEVAFAAEELYYSSNLAMLLIDGLESDLDAQRGLLLYLHEPLAGFSDSPLELGFLCNNAHNQLIDIVKGATFDLFQVIAPYTEEIKQFFLLLDEIDPLPQPEEPKRKRGHPNMVEYEHYSAPA